MEDFLFRTHGKRRLDLVDILTYLYLLLGTIIMFGPVVWLVMSSFKTQTELVQFPPRFLPYRQEEVMVTGYDEPLPLFIVTIENDVLRQLAEVGVNGNEAQMIDPANPSEIITVNLEQREALNQEISLDGYASPLPLYNVTFENDIVRTLAQVRRVGIEAQMIDPANPEEIIRVNINQRVPVEYVYFGLENYTTGIDRFNFWLYFRNSVIVTVAATLLTLLVNSMAAFALSKYQFRGRDTVLFLTIGTLMVPLSVILIPVFLVITQIGWNNNLLGIIVPAAATPTGVFLLRQYMLTIPDELLDSARIDGASEWRIYLQIILPLARPALAVLTIFSVMWRWNDFLWPLIVLSRSEYFTLQVGLNSFQGELQTQWNLILAMTVLTLLPITLVFAFLQSYITSGIATTGMK